MPAQNLCTPGQVITPSAGGPADRAGIEPRDALVAIGDVATEGLTLYEAGDLLQGPEGSEVTFSYETMLA